MRALTRQAYAKWVPVIGREPRPMGADQAAAIRNHRVDLAIEVEAILGLVETVLRPDDLLVENLAVEPGSQKRGLGRLLLAHAEALAADAGRNIVRLYTNARFAENLAFYAARGFEEERREPLLGGTVVHLAKRVTSPDPR